MRSSQALQWAVSGWCCCHSWPRASCVGRWKVCKVQKRVRDRGSHDCTSRPRPLNLKYERNEFRLCLRYSITFSRFATKEKKTSSEIGRQKPLKTNG